MMSLSKDEPGRSVSNSEFLSMIFQCGPDSHERIWTTSFRVNPQHAKGREWEGWPASSFSMAPGTVENNQYFCVSLLSLKGDKVARTGAHFSRLACVVVDDGPLDIAASWTIDTSRGKRQTGYILWPAIDDFNVATRLHNELGRQKLVALDVSGNNPVRYVRLPVGTNTKPDPAFRTQLADFNPDVVFSLPELAEKFGLNLDYILHGPSQSLSVAGTSSALGAPLTPAIDRKFSEDDSTYVRAIVRGEAYHDSLLALTARYIARGMDERTVIQAAQGLMLAMEVRDDRWQSRFDDIGRSVRGAIEKFARKDLPAVHAQVERPLLSKYIRTALTPVATLIRGYLPADGVGMLWAPPASFKSFLAIDWALSVATGREWFGNAVKQGTVWYLAGEGHAGLHLRIAAWCQARGHEGDIDNLMVSDRALTLDSETDALSDHARGLLDLIGAGQAPALIVVDTLSRSMSGDENATRDSARYVAVLDTLVAAVRAQGKSVCVLLVHHARKDSVVYRGSSVLRGAADFECSMERKEGTGEVVLSFEKTKDSSMPAPLHFKAIAEFLGEVTDNHGVVVGLSSLVLWMQAPQRKVDPAESKAQALLPAVTEVLQGYPDGLSTVRLKDLLRVSGAKVSNTHAVGLLETLARMGLLGRTVSDRGSVIWTLGSGPSDLTDLTSDS